MIKKALFISIALFALFACNKEDSNQINSFRSMTFDAKAESQNIYIDTDIPLHLSDENHPDWFEITKDAD